MEFSNRIYEELKELDTPFNESKIWEKIKSMALEPELEKEFQIRSIDFEDFSIANGEKCKKIVKYLEANHVKESCTYTKSLEMVIKESDKLKDYKDGYNAAVSALERDYPQGYLKKALGLVLWTVVSIVCLIFWVKSDVVFWIFTALLAFLWYFSIKDFRYYLRVKKNKKKCCEGYEKYKKYDVTSE